MSDPQHDSHVALHLRLHSAGDPQSQLRKTPVSGQPGLKANVLRAQLTALVIGSCVTCTDPILSQAIAKGPFADRYVARDLREIISSEAGANDGFGFPFLMLATYLLRYTQGDPDQDHVAAHAHVARSGDVGHMHGGLGKAMEMWIVETWVYYIVLGVVYGVTLG